MARAQTSYVCQECGTVHNRWAGRCSGCEAWNSLAEEKTGGEAPVASGARKASRGSALALESLAGTTEDAPRLPTGIDELDRVTGGGLVPGSALLIGGEPGVGKSTLLLQVAASLASAGRTALYFSGEEATAQVRLRAQRLGLADAPVLLGAETNLSNILSTLRANPATDLVVVDSIQTLWSDALESAPGTVSQVRAASQLLIRYAKEAGATLLLVGHVTKEGQIAGPKVVEHMVDTVLYFEGDRGQSFRILRAVKNRFGATDEIGVFEMADAGLREVANPSELFLGDRSGQSPGAAVFAGIEGTRPILVEMQALVAPLAAWHTAPGRRRLGRQPSVHAARGAGGALRRADRCERRLSQRRRRPENHRARRRSRRGRGAHLLARRCGAAARARLFRGNLALGRRQADGIGHIAVERGRETWFQDSSGAGDGRPEVAAQGGSHSSA